MSKKKNLYCDPIVCFMDHLHFYLANFMNKSKVLSAAEVQASIISKTVKKRKLYISM